MLTKRVKGRLMIIITVKLFIPTGVRHELNTNHFCFFFFHLNINVVHKIRITIAKYSSSY